MAKNAKTKKENPKNSLWDIFKFGESYTSLILGIIVVIVATVTLLTFVKGKNETSKLSEIKEQTAAVLTQEISQSSPTPIITKSSSNIKQLVPSKVQATSTENKVSSVQKSKISGNDGKIALNKKSIDDSNYTVVKGDTLWNIAERKYKSGYKWVEIQKTNKLVNANLLHIGTKLILPNEKSKSTNMIAAAKKDLQIKTAIQSNKIDGNNYTVIRGDTLWDIAVRAYGDGYAWVKIARVNKLFNPNLIHSGNKLKIPR